MKSKRFVALNVIIICWALLLSSFALFFFIPEYWKASFVCNGMPEFAVRLLLGEPDDESIPNEQYLMPSSVFVTYNFNGKRMRYARCTDVFEIPLVSEIVPEIRITWVTHLYWYDLIRD